MSENKSGKTTSGQPIIKGAVPPTAAKPSMPQSSRFQESAAPITSAKPIMPQPLNKKK
jgi:hypothetical protein